MLRIGRQYAYSQNLIHSTLLVKRLINKSRISCTDIVIEIGAGKGAITKELACQCREVMAYEVDPNMFSYLKQELGFSNKVTLLNEDFLKAPLPQYPYKVFSNIPFNFTSRILSKLLQAENPPVLSYLVLQEEASNKFVGKPRETQMSLLLKPNFKISVLCDLKRSDFTPKPRVRSVFIEIEKLNTPYLTKADYNEYRDFIVYATTQWKASVAESLRKVLTKEQMKRLADRIGFDPNRAPLDITFNQWLELFNYYHKFVDQNKKRLVIGSYKNQLNVQRGLKKIYRTRKH